MSGSMKNKIPSSEELSEKKIAKNKNMVIFTGGCFKMKEQLQKIGQQHSNYGKMKKFKKK